MRIQFYVYMPEWMGGQNKLIDGWMISEWTHLYIYIYIYMYTHVYCFLPLTQ
jgi:hypothetical protein